MAFSGLRENVILTKIILTTEGTNGYAKSDTWCERGVWHPWWRTILTSAVIVKQAVQPPAPVAEGGVGQCGGNWRWFVTWDRGQGCWVGLHSIYGSLEIADVPVKGWSLTLMNIASFMVLVMLYASLPTTEKFSTLMWWPEMLTWS